MRTLKIFGMAAAVVIAAGTSQASAGSFDEYFGPDGAVFERSYSVDFLKKNTDHKVAKIRFEQISEKNAVKTDDSELSGVQFSVAVKFRDSEDKFEAAGMCFPGEDQMDCRISCNGSGFFLKAEKEGSILLFNTDGFQLNGCSDDTKARVRELKSDEDSFVYNLKPAKQG